MWASTSGRAGVSTPYPQPSVVHAGLLGRALAISLVLLVLVVALMLATLAQNVEGPGASFAWGAAGVVGLADVPLFRWAFVPKTPRLTVRLFGDRIELHRKGHAEDVVSRRDIELIVLDEGSFEGVSSLALYGAGGEQIGRWETGWFVKPPQLVMRLLKRHGFPYAIRRSLYGSKLLYRRAADPSRYPATSSQVVTRVSAGS